MLRVLAWRRVGLLLRLRLRLVGALLLPLLRLLRLLRLPLLRVGVGGLRVADGVLRVRLPGLRLRLLALAGEVDRQQNRHAGQDHDPAGNAPRPRRAGAGGRGLRLRRLLSHPPHLQ